MVLCVFFGAYLLLSFTFVAILFLLLVVSVFHESLIVCLFGHSLCLWDNFSSFVVINICDFHTVALMQGLIHVLKSRRTQV